MNDFRFCPKCGGEILSTERFCGECGFDTQTIGTANHQPRVAQQSPVVPESAVVNPYKEQAVPSAALQQPQVNPQANKNALVILTTVLLVVFLGGGGLYWWFAHGEDETNSASSQSGKQNSAAQTTLPQSTGSAKTAELDLSRASTYLPEAGLKCSFFANYPDGSSGPVERYSARVVPAEAVRMSDVDIINDNGEEIGFGTHYVERADGIYLVYDSVPMEISPLLKNNLMTGLSWKYEDPYGKIVWTVVDMGISLDLGFTSIQNCLLVEEDNQAVGIKKIIYFAPGMGRVMEKSSEGDTEYLKLNAFSIVDQAQAAEKVKKGSPNYQTIKDDRTQS